VRRNFLKLSSTTAMAVIIPEFLMLDPAALQAQSSNRAPNNLFIISRGHLAWLLGNAARAGIRSPPINVSWEYDNLINFTSKMKSKHLILAAIVALAGFLPQSEAGLYLGSADRFDGDEHRQYRAQWQSGGLSRYDDHWLWSSRDREWNDLSRWDSRTAGSK
jgi:hypothetical protein